MTDLSDQIGPSLKKLINLVESEDNEEPKTVDSIIVDVVCALAQDENPFKDFPWNTTKNIFSEILEFGIKNHPFLD